MKAFRGPLVLAILDPGLRSLLAARLGMAGEMLISTADHLDPALGKNLRAAALLIIEESLIASQIYEWSETLRSEDWSGPTIVIVETVPVHALHDETIALVDRRDAGVAVPALVQLLQYEAAKNVS